MKIDFALLLTTSLPLFAIIVIIAGAIVVVIAIALLLVFLLRRKRYPKVDNSVWLLALGGKENITAISAVGSRINLSLNNKETIDREKLKELGVKSVLVMSSKVTLVVESQASLIASNIQESLNN